MRKVAWISRGLLVGAAVAMVLFTPAALAPPPTPLDPTPHITSEQAIARAVNDLAPVGTGYRLRHTRHTAAFTPEGLTFAPRGGGPTWAWRLAHAGNDVTSFAQVRLGPVAPAQDGPEQISYHRGPLIERYVARENAVEQQFVLPRPLPLDGADLVVEGAVTCAGTFAPTDGGWQWRAARGAVHLGDVRVVDARGATIPATMTVTASRTRIAVDGQVLALAAYPVTIDPEIGANDFQISHMGGDHLDANAPAVAYDSVNNRYLVVWHAEHIPVHHSHDEFEIYGLLLDAATGDKVGTSFRLSDMGPDDEPAYDAECPDVAFNPTPAGGEFLVVWAGDDADGEFEIYAQRVNAATGEEIGGDIRLSDMGPDGDPDYDARHPAVAYNGAADAYVVVWAGDDDTSSLADDEFEVYVQRVDASTGQEIGTDVRLSHVGPDGDPDHDAEDPDVASGGDSSGGEVLVVWSGNDDDEREIYGHRVDAATGTAIGDAVRLSDMGPDGDPDYGAYAPAIAYNGTAPGGEYVVVWYGDDDSGALADDEFEIYAQRVDPVTGAEIGTDVRLSDMGPDGDPDYDARHPAVTYNPTPSGGEILVVWAGDDDGTGSLVDDEFEVYGQRVNASTGAEIGADVRLSGWGPDDDPDYNARYPAVAYAPPVGSTGQSTGNEYLVLWEDHNGWSPAWYPEDSEVYAQRVDAASGARIGEASPLGGGRRFCEFVSSADDPAVAYNNVDREYLVVWSGVHCSGFDWATEIYAQRIDAVTGEALGSNVRLSDMGRGSDEEGAYAEHPAVAYNDVDHEYLVVWQGMPYEGTGGWLFEIYGQRVAADTGEEVGTNDFLLSDMEPEDDTASPAVAYNSAGHEYLVVWEGHDHGTSWLYESEIYGQRVDAATGEEIGEDFCLSDMGPTGDPAYGAYSPAIVYSDASDEYLVVWHGDDDTGSLVDDEFEVYAQRVDASTGAKIGPDVRLSDMAPDGDPAYGAVSPAVTYNSTTAEYLVLWTGNVEDTNEGGHAIYGQRIDAVTGEEIGEDTRLTDAPWRDSSPALAHSGALSGNEYLVVWSEDMYVQPPDEPPYDEREIYGQRVDAATGARIGGPFRLSEMGPDGDPRYDAKGPAVAYAGTPAGVEYLVVWAGGLSDFEYGFQATIYGQRYRPWYSVHLPLVAQDWDQ